MRITLLLLVVVLSTCMPFAQVKPFGSADRFSKDAVLLNSNRWLPSRSPAKYLFMKWGVTLDGERGAVTFYVGEWPPLDIGPPHLPHAILSNGIPPEGSTTLPLEIESDRPLKRIGFVLIPHDVGLAVPPPIDVGFAVPATTTITAFDRSGQVLGTVVEHQAWIFVGLEAVGPEGISRVTIKSDQGIEGIENLIVEYPSRPQFTTYLPQLANGEGFRSSITFLNLSDSTAEGAISVYDPAGAGLDLGGLGETTHFSIPPGASKALMTSATGQLKTGYAVVTSDCPLQVQALYTTSGSEGTVREAGIVGVTASYGRVGAPVVKDPDRSVDTAIAVVNPNDENWGVWFDLIDNTDGSLPDSAPVGIPSHGQIAKFIWEVFPQLAGKAWQGSVRIRSSKPVAVMMVRTLDGVATSSFPVASY